MIDSRMIEGCNSFGECECVSLRWEGSIDAFKDSLNLISIDSVSTKPISSGSLLAFYSVCLS